MNTKNELSDKDIEDYLADKSEESALYQSAKDIRAPEHLSFAVKKMARDALKEDISSAGSSDKPTANRFWPVAMAASVMLAVVVGVFYSSLDQSESNPVIASNGNEQQDIATVQPEIESGELAESTPAVLTEQEVQQLVEVAPVVNKTVENTDPEVNDKEQAKLALVDTQEQVNTGEQPSASVQKVRPADATPANDVAKETHEIPEHLKGLLQNASVSDQNLNQLPPDEVLKQWSHSQWVEQVKTLQKQGKEDLAQRYINAFPKYYPDQDLQVLLKL